MKIRAAVLVGVVLAAASCGKSETSPKPAQRSPEAVEPAKSATATPAGWHVIVLDDLERPTETRFGGTVRPGKPFKAQISVPDGATASMDEGSTKYDKDAEAYPRILASGWTIELENHISKTLAEQVKGYKSAGFEILRQENTPDGYIVVVGSRSKPLEAVVTKTSLDISCYATLDESPDQAIAVCQTLAPRGRPGA